MRLGSVEGTVIRLSPSTYLDERRRPYYRALIALVRPYLGDRPDRFRIIPGMTGEVDIRSGEKTVMAFLMKAVTRGLDSAFSER